MSLKISQEICFCFSFLICLPFLKKRIKCYYLIILLLILILFFTSLHWKTVYMFFFKKQHLYSNEPHCCLTFSRIELEILLNTYNHHYIETHFIFSIFVSISRSRCIFVVFMWFIFLFQPHFHCQQTHLFFVHFLGYFLLFFDGKADKESE